MGCDIHGYIEVKKDKGWVPFEELPSVRSYDLFAMLANVRNYNDIPPISEPRGVPDDVSQEIWEKIEADLDGHSHSWLSWKDIKAYDFGKVITDKRRPRKLKGKIVYPRRKLYELVPEEWHRLFRKMEILAEKYGEDGVRMVFWFDS